MSRLQQNNLKYWNVIPVANLTQAGVVLDMKNLENGK